MGPLKDVDVPFLPLSEHTNKLTLQTVRTKEQENGSNMPQSVRELFYFLPVHMAFIFHENLYLRRTSE